MSVSLDLLSLDTAFGQWKTMFHHVTDDMTDTESSDCKSLSPCLKGWCEREVPLVEELEGGERRSRSFISGSICGLWDNIKCELIKGDYTSIDDGVIRHNVIKVSLAIFSYLLDN